MKTVCAVRPDPDLALLSVRFDRRVHQRGASPGKHLTFGLPTGTYLQSWKGQSVEDLRLVDFGVGREFDGVSVPGFNALTFSLAQDFAETLLATSGLTLKSPHQDRGALPLSHCVGALPKLIATAYRYLRQPEAPFGKPEKEELALALLLTAADTEALEERSRSHERQRSVREAIEIMEQQAADELTIGRLCTLSGVSWRTLDRGFRETFGIGPKAYLNRLRLSRVRTDLLHIGKDRRIADVANDWGFWHMGQFAKDYRLMFGELPSETASLKARSMVQTRALAGR